MLSSSKDRRLTQRKSIQNSDPGKILNLVMKLTDDQCANLQIKINKYLQEECEAELVLMLEVHTDRMESAVQAVGTNSLTRKYKIVMNQLFMDAIKSGMSSYELLSNTGEDFQTVVTPHLLKENPKRRVMIVPIVSKPYSILVFVIKPSIIEERVIIMVNECFLFCWPTLKKSIALDYERNVKQKCQQLLRVTKRLFTQVASLETLLQIVMEQAKQLTHAEHCCVYLVDVEGMELVETSFFGNAQEEKEAAERRFPMNIGITGHVVKTGSLVNAKNTPEHSNFNPIIDGHPGLDCKTMLCFPIREQTGIIGVGQLINKLGDPYFDAMDEEMALAFSIYCGVCIVHSVIYQKIQEAHIRNALANELVMYHMKVADNEVNRVLECTGFHQHPHFINLNFNPRALPTRELPCYAMKMFLDLGFDKKFHIKAPKLVRFILHVKKGYRDVSYHNWLHGFSVAQWAYAALLNYKLVQQGYLSDLQALMYLISGLVHDLDHRGTTNSFQIQGQTTLAALYSSEGSVLERHHLAQAICILNTEGCDILEALPRKDYDRALIMLRDYVLASDLANYFKNANDYRIIAEDYQKGNRLHVSTLQALLMNAADLSDQLKEWSVVKKTAVGVLTEFFRQGDTEKSRGELPATIMDREKCFIPDLEMSFLSHICIPLYNTIAKIIPKAEAIGSVLVNHIERWDASKSVFEEVPLTAGLSVLLSQELDTLIELNLQEKERIKQEEEAAAAAAAAEGQ